MAAAKVSALFVHGFQPSHAATSLPDAIKLRKRGAVIHESDGRVVAFGEDAHVAAESKTFKGRPKSYASAFLITYNTFIPFDTATTAVGSVIAQLVQRLVPHGYRLEVHAHSMGGLVTPIALKHSGCTSMVTGFAAYDSPYGGLSDESLAFLREIPAKAERIAAETCRPALATAATATAAAATAAAVVYGASEMHRTAVVSPKKDDKTKRTKKHDEDDSFDFMMGALITAVGVGFGAYMLTHPDEVADASDAVGGAASEAVGSAVRMAADTALAAVEDIVMPFLEPVLFGGNDAPHLTEAREHVLELSRSGVKVVLADVPPGCAIAFRAVDPHPEWDALPRVHLRHAAPVAVDTTQALQQHVSLHTGMFDETREADKLHSQVAKLIGAPA